MPTSSQRPSSSSRDLTLVVESESGTPEEYFAQVGLSIGRAKSNTIHIDHPDVDHIHAKVVKREESFWMAAQQGHVLGQRNLGAMYMKGGSVPVNYVMAYAWFGIAASNGNESAVGWKGTASKKMTPGQIAAGEKFSKDIIAKFPKVVRRKLVIVPVKQAPPNKLAGPQLTPEQLCQRGLNAIIAKNNNEALKWYRQAAEHGHARAQAILGICYDGGKMVVEDDMKAVNWYRKAAEQGLAEAQFLLGVMYDEGKGVPEDDEEAVKWWRKAALQGDASAQYNLGVKYSSGKGVPKNDKEAVKWYRKAAEQGVAKAQHNLGVKYSRGEGVPEDDREAVKWWRKAAEQGFGEAQSNLGWMYDTGEGVLEDDVTAYAWFNIAASKGLVLAKNNKAFLAKEMSPNQIAEGQKLSRELLARIEANKAGKPEPSDLPSGRPLIDPDTGLPIWDEKK